MPEVPLQRDQYHNVVQETYLESSFRGEYDGDDNLIYAGNALPGSSEDDPVWQIRQINYDGTNPTSVLWPQINSKASRDYSFAWTDRATYTYS